MQNHQVENSNIRTIGRGRDYWRELIAVWQQSNEHPRDFCVRMNVKIGTFAHWRGIFSKEQKPRPNKFIELQVSHPIKSIATCFTIECPSGHKITFPAGLKKDEVQQILAILGLTA